MNDLADKVEDDLSNLTSVIQDALCRLLPSAECAICRDYIILPQISCVDCKCKLLYHHSCLITAYKDVKQRGRCLQCSKVISRIYTWKYLLTVYFNKVEWSRLYEKLYGRFDKLEHIINLTNFFYYDIKLFRYNKLCINKYGLIPILDYYEFMKFNKKEHYAMFKSIFTEILDNTFINPPQPIMIRPHYKTGEYVINNRETFERLFSEFTYNLIDVDFNWSNIILAGGSLFRLLSPYMCNNVPDSSDIDLFVFGDDKSIISAIERTLTYFKDRYGDDVIYLVRLGSLIEIYVRGFSRHIQIVCNMASSPLDILERFDFDHLQLCYFSGELYATPICIDHIKMQISNRSVRGRKIRYDRLLKSLSFKMSVILDEVDDIKNDVKKLCNSGNIFLLTPDNVEEYKKESNSVFSLELSKNFLPEYHPKCFESDECIIKRLRYTRSEIKVISKEIDVIMSGVKIADHNYYYL
jgi:hypothetical protein